MKILTNEDVMKLEVELLTMSALGSLEGGLRERAQEIINELSSGYRSNRSFKLELIQGGK